jgi:hypothetical protein
MQRTAHRKNSAPPLIRVRRTVRQIVASWPLCLSLAFLTGCGPGDAEIDTVINRGRPLIQAIQAFEKANGYPPESLDVLTPRYISAIPTTGLDSFPTFHYRVRSRSPNDWRINVQLESLGFRHMRFDPRGTYEIPASPLRDGWALLSP